MNNITIFFVSLKCKQKNKTLCYPTTKLLKFSIWQTTSAIFLIKLLKNILLRKRALIESTNDELKNIAQIEHSRHRSFSNFIVNTIAALAAYCFFPKKPSIHVECYCDNHLTI